MDAYAIHAADLKDLENEAGGDCPAMWYNSTPIAVLPGGSMYRQSHSVGGEMISFDLSLTVLAADFGANFSPNQLSQQTFNYPGQNGNAYRVEHVVTMPNSRQLRILANAAAEGL